MGWITRVHGIRCNVPPLFPFNREPASPDKATCNLSQLVLFSVSRFSASVLYLSPIDHLSYPSIFTPFCFFHSLFCLPGTSNRIVCMCVRVRPTFAATGKVYNRSRLTERSNIVSAESCRIVRVRINDEKGTRLRYQRS